MAVRREDYRPPAWLVPEVALAFELEAGRARVRARLEVVRGGDHREPLRLDGIGLRLRSLTVDGRPASHKLDKAGLTIKLATDRATVETLVELTPSTAAQQGLFNLGGVLCTQCEPEHFRRITFFPDRPDVLSRFTVRIEADRARYPVLLSNGDRRAGGEGEGGRHWVEWHDPHPKPCYLFALVAGQLAARTDSFVTRSGREVALGVWAHEADLPLAGPALAALKAAMRWDEDRYGRAYDLSVYNLVALPGFAFGAMENKGLAIHDAGQVLADPDTATDAELDVVAALVAHEYLHNWSGNRVTVRDWFELSLKEGFTVFRDQCFSADRGEPAVKRIEDVRSFKAAQFTEDAGPRARPVRPASYDEVGELFTATTYVKGAEIVRMIRTVLGEAAFRAGAELFFTRHDGQAVRWEALLAAMEEASGARLAGYLRWCEAAGTPTVRAVLDYDADSRQAALRLAQAPAQPPLPIPLRVALFGAESGARLAEALVVLEQAELTVAFADLGERPVLSINRGFSAPVRMELTRSPAELALLAMHEDDPFARHEAMQQLMLAVLRDPSAGPEPLVAAIRHALRDAALEPALVAELVSLPTESVACEGTEPIDPGAIHAAWKRLRADLGRALEVEWRAACAAPADDKGARRLRGVALGYLLASGAADAGAIALDCMDHAPNMTEREAALRALADSDAPERAAALAAFYQRYRLDPRLLDKWFAVQAGSARDDTIELAPRLLAHPDFTAAQAGRLSAVVGGFAATPHAFHDPSGRGYRFVADVALVLDRSNPTGAARLARVFEGWRRYEPARAALIRAQLERIAATPGVSAALAAGATASLG